MTALLKIINSGKEFTEKTKELKEYLDKNSEIIINNQLFSLAISNALSYNGDLINGQEEIAYLILHHCI